jgi:hypothetical protein
MISVPLAHVAGLPIEETLGSLAARRVTLAARVPTRVTLSLSKKNSASLRRALSTGRALTAMVTVTVRDAAGNVSSRKLALRLRRVSCRYCFGARIGRAPSVSPFFHVSCKGLGTAGF